MAAAAVGLGASTLSVYQDRSIYTTHLQSDFIGLTKNITAKCEGESVALRVMETCPPSQRLCAALYSKIEAAKTTLRQNRLNSEILQTLISLPKPNSFDAQKAIAAAQAVAKEQTRLLTQKEKTAHRLKQLKAELSRQARASQPVGLKRVQPCSRRVKLK